MADAAPSVQAPDLRLAVLQSNYIPWKGYFDIIHDVDLFVFHDDNQYTERDWCNRIKIASDALRLSARVCHDRHRVNRPPAARRVHAQVRAVPAPSWRKLPR